MTFSNHMLIVKWLKAVDQPKRIPLFHADFWVQIHNLPIGFRSEFIEKNVGNYIRKFLEVDAKSLGDGWKNFMRVRVSLDVRLPLKRHMGIRMQGGDWHWVNFQYERLPMFYFICGVLGHSNSACELLFENPQSYNEKAYGIYMQANYVRNNNNSSAKWLREGPPEKPNGDAIGNDDGSIMDMDSPRNMPSDKGEDKQLAKYNVEEGDNSGYAKSTPTLPEIPLTGKVARLNGIKLAMI